MRCGCSSGPVGACACAFADSDCFNVTGAGTAENPFVIEPIIDPDPANPLSCGVNGLTSAQEAAVVNPPRGFATRAFAVPQSIPDTTLTPIDLTDPDTYDTDSQHDPAVNPSRVVTNTAGIYHFNGHAGFDANANGERGMALIRNGSFTFGNDDENNPSATITTSMDTSGDVALAVGDYVQMSVIKTGGGALNVEGARLTWHYVGPTP